MLLAAKYYQIQAGNTVQEFLDTHNCEEKEEWSIDLNNIGSDKEVALPEPTNSRVLIPDLTYFKQSQAHYNKILTHHFVFSRFSL